MSVLPVGTPALPPAIGAHGLGGLRQALRRPSSVVVWGFLLLVVVLSLAAPLLSSYEPTTQDFSSTLLAPGSPGHLAGTDNLGRDQFTRLLYGGRPIMLTAVCSVVISTVVGTLLGLWAGYRGGWLDAVVARGMDVLLSFPLILLAIMIVAALGSGVQNVILAISISQLPVFARLSRALTLREREREYVLAVRAAGFGAPRILFREILPNLVGPIIVQATSTVAVATSLSAALSYLGLGVQPPNPDWGLMVKEAQEFLFDAPDLAIVPGVLITLFVLACNFAGDDLRDVLDPGNALSGKRARA
ncbi:ABC transporter permease [uncultured Friedmanniella sp.]|uniref:ABC transporter permease n=1 Tax=uncultured Friedmanniella sp. TaxID=335381 RepID=UPI0035CB9D5E